MRGEISSGAVAMRHPLDWYVEEEWVTEQLIRAVGFRDELLHGDSIWDPAAGYGHIGSAFEGWGFGGRIVLSDVVRNVNEANFAEPFRFISGDFLEFEATELVADRFSIVCNPPYSYKKHQLRDGRKVIISEAFARHALKLVGESSGRRVCVLVPSKWLSAQSRWQLCSEFPPAAILHLTQRPSMPPGDRIAAMGDRAHKRGMVDYCWIVWDVRHPTAPGETRTHWLPPLGEPIEPIEALT